MHQASCGEWNLRLSPPALSPLWGQLLPLPPSSPSLVGIVGLRGMVVGCPVLFR